MTLSTGRKDNGHIFLDTTLDPTRLLQPHQNTPQAEFGFASGTAAGIIFFALCRATASRSPTLVEGTGVIRAMRGNPQATHAWRLLNARYNDGSFRCARELPENCDNVYAKPA